MKAVITADIINSTKSSSNSWIVDLKKALKNFGKEGKDWEIFRGDEFQILLDKPELAFIISVMIKASLNSNGIDAKMAIGLGEISYHGKTIKESNGSAFINSGRTLDILKGEKYQKLALKSDISGFDEQFKLIFQLLETTFDNWTESSAKAILAYLQNQELNQIEIAKKLGISQSAFSQFLKKTNAEAIIATDQYYRKKIAEIS
ncbi:hypothetical protein [Frigoriflavimonas asaccharolytica]|uniref:SatD family protein n=1 Tax=Frigoriflavimonas asaccharolytica TaxID=2735899 RepID=A0A8J8G5C8_9FLAO|nr:hypothetical protein [Frigoriflavimonas asaccharolytica]NRS91554.1 hypothetical protein [Frigoriflavimonas asaccharolytica]